MAKIHSPNLASNGRYRVIIGGRTFWCGKDQQIAIKLTNALDVAWDNEQSKRADGKKCWSNQSINKAFQLVGVRSPVASEPEPTPAPPQPSALVPRATTMPTFKPAFLPTDITLHKALDLYVEMRLGLKTIRRAGEDSESVVGSLKVCIPDTALHSIDAAAQGQIANIILSRPPHRKTGQPIALPTVRKWLQELGAAFEYFSHPDSRIGWVPSYPQWREKFYLNDKEAEAMAINAGEEEFGKVKPTYTIDQLIPIWKQATVRGRLYLLGGVCLGWTAMEFATLRRDQIFTDKNGDTYILDKKRSKTGVPMSFWVCPELFALLNKGMAESTQDLKINPQGLALLTRNRQGDPFPLVHGKTDTVGELWTQTVKRVNRCKVKIPFYPHSHLRKLAGQLIENLTGNHDLGQMILSHKKADVASTNYIGNNVHVGAGRTQLQRLWDAQKEVHKELAPLFASDKPREPKVQQANDQTAAA